MPPRPQRFTSPTLRGLARSGTDAVWPHVVREGTPLVEPDPTSAETVLATFCWRADPAAAPDWVYLLANGLTDRAWFTDGLLDRWYGTDLWHVTLRVPNAWRGGYGLVVGHGPVPVPPDDAEAERRWWTAILRATFPDPFSRIEGTHDTSLGMRLSEAAMPQAPPQRWWAAGTAMARAGTQPEPPEWSHDRVRLAGVERSVWALDCFGPSAEPKALVVGFDGASWVEHMPLRPTLAALAGSGEVPPFVVVLVDSVDPGLRAEELTASPRFRAAVCDELVGWLEARHTLTTDAARRIAVGQSFGGLAAVDLALEAPDVFGAAVAQSGSYWWPGDDEDGRPQWIWRDHLAVRDRRGVRLWLEAGVREGDMADLSRRFAADAREAGADVVLRLFDGAHDAVQWREGFVEGVVALLGGPDGTGDLSGEDARRLP